MSSSILRCGPPPTKQKVVDYLVQGLSDAEIGERVGLARVTVKANVAQMRAAFNASNRVALVVRLVTLGYRPEEDS